MAWDTALPFGARDTKVVPYTTAALTALGTAVDTPNARSFSFSESEDFEELRGDDKVVAIRGLGASVEWEMESGGISIPAYTAMNGGLAATTGVTPSQVTTYTKKAADQKPYIQLAGQAMSDSGGDFHIVLPRARASEGVEGELSDGSFWLTGASGVALPALKTGDIDTLYKFILNETAVAGAIVV